MQEAQGRARLLPAESWRLSDPIFDCIPRRGSRIQGCLKGLCLRLAWEIADKERLAELDLLRAGSKPSGLESVQFDATSNCENAPVPVGPAQNRTSLGSIPDFSLHGTMSRYFMAVIHYRAQGAKREGRLESFSLGLCRVQGKAHVRTPIEDGEFDINLSKQSVRYSPVLRANPY